MAAARAAAFSAVITFAVLAFAPPASAAAPPLARHVSPNGLEVIVSENHAVPLVTIELAVKNGAYTEGPEYSGLSHLYEHMFFKANAVLANQEAYLARTRELGMMFDGTTGNERVNYFFTTTRAHLDEALVFMRDAAVSPLFDARELEQERVVVTGEIDRNESTPQYHLWHQVSKRVWWKYPTRKWAIGDRRTVLGATREKMKTIQQRYYVPNNSLLVVTGDVEAAKIFARADELFASWPRGQDPFEKYPIPEHPPIPRTEVVVVEQPVETFSGVMTWHGPSTAGDSVDLTYAADFFTTAIEEQSSPFQKALVESGACIAASFVWSTEMHTGPINLSFEADPGKVDACVRAILAELPRMREPSYLSDEELAGAIRRLEVMQVLEREKPSEHAHVISYFWCSGGLDYYLGYVENTKRVTRADITRYLDRYVLGKPFIFGALLSPQMVREKRLDRAHFEELLGVKR